ncbi:hypothetical protein ACG83_39410 [Frankia sp. R43]|nr:ABC transporter permease [Frankia sp. R43]KPM50610.1 hypothetical protein ACG83_39410 [Frankia sp. R43]
MALLVGGIGVANTVVISVLERRGEIGLRCSLCATRSHIRSEFLTEALLLPAIGGTGGLFLGIAVTTLYANIQDWPTVIPSWATGHLASTPPSSSPAFTPPPAHPNCHPLKQWP